MLSFSSSLHPISIIAVNGQSEWHSVFNGNTQLKMLEHSSWSI